MICSLVLQEPDCQAYNKHHRLLRAYLSQASDIVFECFEAELHTFEEGKELQGDYVAYHLFVGYVFSHMHKDRRMEAGIQVHMRVPSEGVNESSAVSIRL